MFRFDAHVHSAHSDGTDAPADLVRLAARAGLTGLALMDHDTTSGWAPAAQVARAEGLALLPGIELSTSHGGRSIHLLAYLPDPHHPELVGLLSRIRAARTDRLREMVDRLSRDFPRVTWEGLQEMHGAVGVPWGRPHIADALVAAGYIPDRSAAFAQILHPRSPYYVLQWAPEPAVATDIIRRAGGVPVVAHPFTAKRGRTAPESLIGEMADAGLFGLERDHREHGAAARQLTERLASKYGLALTGGSDYHGTGKPNRLGENVTEADAVQEILRQGSPLVAELPGEHWTLA